MMSGQKIFHFTQPIERRGEGCIGRLYSATKLCEGFFPSSTIPQCLFSVIKGSDIKPSALHCTAVSQLYIFGLTLPSDIKIIVSLSVCWAGLVICSLPIRRQVSIAKVEKSWQGCVVTYLSPWLLWYIIGNFIDILSWCRSPTRRAQIVRGWPGLSLTNMSLAGDNLSLYVETDIMSWLLYYFYSTNWDLNSLQFQKNDWLIFPLTNNEFIRSDITNPGHCSHSQR